MMMRKFGLISLLVLGSLGTSWAVVEQERKGDEVPGSAVLISIGPETSLGVERDLKEDEVSASTRGPEFNPESGRTQLVAVSGFMSSHPSHETDQVILTFDSDERIGHLIKRVQFMTPFEIENLEGGPKDSPLKPATFVSFSIGDRNWETRMVSRTMGSDGTYNLRAGQKEDDRMFAGVLMLSIIPKNAVQLTTFSGNTFTVAFKSDQTVRDLKESYYKVAGVPADQVRLIWGQREMRDEALLSEYSVNGKVIGVVHRLKPVE